jgi:hypothetical protein
MSTARTIATSFAYLSDPNSAEFLDCGFMSWYRLYHDKT